jgi:hypothetical protein
MTLRPPKRSCSFSLHLFVATLTSALAASAYAAVVPPHSRLVDGGKGCFDFPIEDDRALTGLYRRAAAADHAAVQKLLCVLPKLDGGELEDALVAVGKVIIRPAAYDGLSRWPKDSRGDEFPCKFMATACRQDRIEWERTIGSVTLKPSRYYQA